MPELWTAQLARRLAYRIFGTGGIVLFEYPIGNGVQERRFDAIAFDPYTIRNVDAPVRVLEFKSSRADFTSDQKWLEYLPYCSQFGFLAPEGAIHYRELPYGVGLFVPDADGSLRIVKPWKPRALDPVNRERVFDRFVRRAIGQMMARERDRLDGIERWPDDEPAPAPVANCAFAQISKPTVPSASPVPKTATIATHHPAPASSLIDLLAPRRTHVGFDPTGTSN